MRRPSRTGTGVAERAAREQEIRRRQRELEQEQRTRARIAETERVVLPPSSEAIDLMAVTSGAAEWFRRQPAADKRRLLNRT